MHQREANQSRDCPDVQPGNHQKRFGEPCISRRRQVPGVRIRRPHTRALLREDTLAEPRGREEEHETAHQAHVRQQGVDGSEVALPHAARDDALDGTEHPRGPLTARDNNRAL